MASIKAICISEHKGTVKLPVAKAEFVEGFGIQDDGHAGPGHRQISLLASESIEPIKEQLPDLAHGAFGENVITEGLFSTEIQIGDRLQLGENVLLEVTQIGKECHNGCIIQKSTGHCIMPIEGIFARVLTSGSTRDGDAIKLRK